MAAEARHYEKNGMTYSSRQGEGRYSKKRLNSSRSPESPYQYKSRSSNHSSPVSRKRAYESPKNKHKSNYDVARKKDRGQDSRNSSPQAITSEWSKHKSSTGKIYYYNKRTEQSQWDPPKEFSERDKVESSRGSSRDLRNDDDRYKSRDYRDSKHDPKRDSYYDTREDSRRHKSSDYRKENHSNHITSIKSMGQVTPHSKTSINRSRHETPDQVNGSLQDISPPGTPTNDDTPSINNTPMTPITPLTSLHLGHHHQILSPKNLIAVSPVALPITLPITSFLHPLQQALMLKQQVVTTPPPTKDVYNSSPKLPTVKPHLTNSSASNPSSPRISSLRKQPQKQSGVSPLRLNTTSPPPPPPPPRRNKSDGKLSESGRTAESSSRTAESSSRGSSEKERRTSSSSNNRELLRKQNSYSSNRTPERSSDSIRSSKSTDSRSSESKFSTPVSSASAVDSTSKNKTPSTIERTNSKNGQSARKLLDVARKVDVVKKFDIAEWESYKNVLKALRTSEEQVVLADLPTLDKYMPDVVTNAPPGANLDFVSGFYATSIDRQASSCCDEILGYLLTEDYRSKHSVIAASLDAESKDLSNKVRLHRLTALTTVSENINKMQDTALPPRSDKSAARKKLIEVTSSQENSSQDSSNNSSQAVESMMTAKNNGLDVNNHNSSLLWQ